MRDGRHIVRGGFGELYDIGSSNPDLPRRIPVFNGSFENNFRLKSLQLMPASTNRDAGNEDQLSSRVVMFQISVTPTGCLPIAGATKDHDSYCLRFDDPSIVGWGIIGGNGAGEYHIRDEAILIDDVFITAWSLTTAGNLKQGLEYGIGYMLEFEPIKNSGAQGIVFTYRENQEEDL